MKRILSTIALIVVAALLFWVSQPAVVISQAKPYMSSLYVAVKIINSGYMVVTDSLRVGNTLTANGGINIAGAVSPTADGTRDLGTDVAKWDSVFAGHVKTTNLNASGAATFATTIGVTGASTLDSTYMRKLVLNAGTKSVIDSLSKVHADTAAIWISGVAYVLPKRP